MSKTVYILGAGFSKSAGGPLQSDIIPQIYKIKHKDFRVEQYSQIYFKYKRALSDLLSNIFFLDKREYKNFPLEDIYSTIDRCLLDNLSLGKFGKTRLIELRDKINALIIMLMDVKLQYSFFDDSNDHIHDFSNYLIDKKIKSFQLNPNSDPFTIISTNWDIVIENSLKAIIDIKQGNNVQDGFLDYCFYVHAYKENEPNIKIRSGQYWRGKGLYNVKVLKLHGSMNWLQCQRCQRVFITFFEKIAKDEFISKPSCRLCNRFTGKMEGSELKSVLVMPTFLKDLNVFQLKLSWQLAGIELQEADNIVFMGYSFPMADFELRQLLARSVRQKTKIEVVLHRNDEPIRWKGVDKLYQYLPEHRFKSFFGKRDIKFFYNGVEDYITRLINGEFE